MGLKNWASKGFTISELLVVMIIVFAAGLVLLPAVKYSSSRMDKTICTNNLREMGLALYIYAEEHGGEFPPSIKALYEQGYLSDERITDCPANKDKGTPEQPDYIYTAGLSAKSSSNGVLLKDRAKNHSSEWKNVMRVDGTISAGEENNKAD
ncbi:MAG: type II secretion system protein [Candidatus Omnitrophota bacterium]|nr:type II secretion system GspH family protein [Candidatus Omnitrophota bacterium]